MIKLYENGKLYCTFETYNIKDLTDIQIIFESLKDKYKNLDYPDKCEEPMQYIMRNNGFTLLDY